MRILTAAESRQVDRWAIETLGLPGCLLMEHAARGLRERLLAEVPLGKRIAVVCGPGNNGGDGLALVRLLAESGRKAQAVLVRWGAELSADCALQLQWLRRLGIEVAEEPSLDALLMLASNADVVVDALFGTGLRGPLRDEPARWVAALSRLDRPVLAVDLPSGLGADCGRIEGVVWPARWTVTFGALKPAHVLPWSAELCGEVTVVGLGFPIELPLRDSVSLWWLDDQTVRGWLRPRSRDSHKGQFGHLLLVAGSLDMPGAALLAAMAAVRSGVGLVTGAVPAAIHLAMPGACPEAMWKGLGQEEAAKEVGLSHLGELEPLLLRATAMALGPGMGRTPGTQKGIVELAMRFPGPLVLDADGLAPFEGCLDRLRSRSGPTVLTPHPGELSRLLGCSTAEIQADRVRWTREAARQSQAVVVLKGHRTVVSRPEGEAWINSSGTSALAVGGSGDVLTGLLGGLLAQGMDPAHAAAVAVLAHGLAAERVVQREAGLVVPAGHLARGIGNILAEFVT